MLGVRFSPCRAKQRPRPSFGELLVDLS